MMLYLKKQTKRQVKERKVFEMLLPLLSNVKTE